MNPPTPTASPAQKMSPRLRTFCLTNLVPGVTAGAIIGMMNIALSISLAALIFSGTLSGYVSRGIGFFLFGACIIGLLVSVTSLLPNMIATPQDIPAAILATAAAEVVNCMPQPEGAVDAFLTVAVMLMLTTLLTGVLFLLLGACRLGNLTRFIPYPVIGGFLAGSGWLLLKGGVSVMTDLPEDVAQVSVMFQGDVLTTWLPGCLFGLLLLIVLRRSQHILAMPLMVVGGIVSFLLLLAITGTSFAEAGARGWLMGPFPHGRLWQPLTFAELQQVHWALILKQIGGSIGTIMTVSAIALLFNASGLELATRRDIDLNRELIAAGVGNILAGMVGGSIGYQELSDTALGYRMTPHSRLAGVWAAALYGIALIFGASLFSFFPKFLAGGLLVYLGLSFLMEWVYDAWFSLSKTDYFLVLTILVIVGTFGFLRGVLAGIVMTIAIFVFTYSRIPVVKHTLSGNSFRSMMERAVVERQILSEYGEELAILQLQGYLFFGTANTLLLEIRERVEEAHLLPIRFLALDFRLVSGMDSSALNSFIKLKYLSEQHGMTIIMTNLLPKIRQQFEQANYAAEGEALVRFFPDLDHGVEWCEDQILMRQESDEQDRQAPQRDTLLEVSYDEMLQSLAQQERFELVVMDLKPYLEYHAHEAGDCLICQGERADALYFIESGQALVQVEDHAGGKKRLRTLTAGTVVGELGVYWQHPASATVVIEQPGVIYRLSFEAFQRIKLHDPQKMIHFQEFMVYLLSERLGNANRLLHAVLD